MSALAVGGGRGPGAGLRWGSAALVVAALHVGAGWWLVTRSFAPPPPEGVVGVTVELEPVAVPAPPTAEPKPLETAGPAPTPQIAEAPDAQPEPLPAGPPAPEPPMESPVPPTPAEPPPLEAAVAPPPEPPPPVLQTEPEPDPTPAAPATIPEVMAPPAAVPSDAVLAPPPHKPVKKLAAAKPPKPIPLKPDPREVAREEARREAKAEAAAETRAQRQAARQQARAARAAAAREGGGQDRESAAPVASGASVSSWRGEVMAHINAYKPSSPDGNAGSVRVAFSIDRGGRVVSASVSSSSGDPQLDAAAISMVRRASPVPAPPPEMGGRVSLVVPVNFH